MATGVGSALPGHRQRSGVGHRLGFTCFDRQFRVVCQRNQCGIACGRDPVRTKPRSSPRKRLRALVVISELVFHSRTGRDHFDRLPRKRYPLEAPVQIPAHRYSDRQASRAGSLRQALGVIASSQCMHGGHSLEGQVTLRSMPRHFVVGGARNGWIAWCSSPPSFLPINPWRMGVADAKNGRGTSSRRIQPCRCRRLASQRSIGSCGQLPMLRSASSCVCRRKTPSVRYPFAAATGVGSKIA